MLGELGSQLASLPAVAPAGSCPRVAYCAVAQSKVVDLGAVSQLGANTVGSAAAEVGLR